MFDPINNYLLNDNLIKNISFQLFTSLEKIHLRNIAHMDLKIDNLMLNKNF